MNQAVFTLPAVLWVGGWAVWKHVAEIVQATFKEADGWHARGTGS